MKCGDAGCRKINESFEEYVNHNTETVKKISNMAIEKYEKISCHPLMKKHVNPVVKYFWDFMPI